MATAILIIGESGTGKSTSLENLNPKETFLLNVLDKPLPFAGWRKNYTPLNQDNPQGNYAATVDIDKIRKTLRYINEKRPDIKNVIIDDWQYTLVSQFMDGVMDKGYTKFSEIGQMGWKTLKDAIGMRDDLCVFVMSQNTIDNTGHSRVKTLGKMLENVITVEGMFTIVFHTMVNDGKYQFLTQNDGMHLAKSPKGMFPTLIDNDLSAVVSRVREYEGATL